MRHNLRHSKGQFSESVFLKPDVVDHMQPFAIVRHELFVIMLHRYSLFYPILR